jgi:hypothetical protein
MTSKRQRSRAPRDLTDLTLSKSPAPVAFDDSVLDNVARDRLWGVSPLTGYGIRRFHYDFPQPNFTMHLGAAMETAGLLRYMLRPYHGLSPLMTAAHDSG